MASWFSKARGVSATSAPTLESFISRWTVERQAVDRCSFDSSFVSDVSDMGEYMRSSLTARVYYRQG